MGSCFTVRKMYPQGGTAVLPKSQWTQESGRELLSVKCECRGCRGAVSKMSASLCLCTSASPT